VLFIIFDSVHGYNVSNENWRLKHKNNKDVMLACCTQFILHALKISVLIISITTVHTHNDNEYQNTTRKSISVAAVSFVL